MSLVETTVALFLAAILIVVLVNLFPASVAAVRQAEARSHALSFAESELSVAQSRPFSELTLGSLTENETILDGITYSSVLEITEVDGRDPAYLRSLKVTVTWRWKNKHLTLKEELLVANLKR